MATPTFDEISKLVATTFEDATPEQWELLQSELVRYRGAISAAVLNSGDRWGEWGARGEQISQLLWEILGFEKHADWFEQVQTFLDGTERPYLFICLDAISRPGVMMEPGNVNIRWRSTLSREAALEVLAGVRHQIMSEPQVLAGVEEWTAKADG